MWPLQRMNEHQGAIGAGISCRFLNFHLQMQPLMLPTPRYSDCGLKVGNPSTFNAQTLHLNTQCPKARSSQKSLPEPRPLLPHHKQTPGRAVPWLLFLSCSSYLVPLQPGCSPLFCTKTVFPRSLTASLFYLTATVNPDSFCWFFLSVGLSFHGRFLFS